MAAIGAQKDLNYERVHAHAEETANGYLLYHLESDVNCCLTPHGSQSYLWEYMLNGDIALPKVTDLITLIRPKRHLMLSCQQYGVYQRPAV